MDRRGSARGSERNQGVMWRKRRFIEESLCRPKIKTDLWLREQRTFEAHGKGMAVLFVTSIQKANGGNLAPWPGRGVDGFKARRRGNDKDEEKLYELFEEHN